MDPSENTSKTKKNQFGYSISVVLISSERIIQSTPSKSQIVKKLEAKSFHGLIYESNDKTKQAKVNEGKYVVRRNNKLYMERNTEADEYISYKVS